MNRTLTIAQAAAEIRVSYHTLARWIRNGDGPRHFRMGRVVRIDRDELTRWLRLNSTGERR